MRPSVMPQPHVRLCYGPLQLTPRPDGCKFVPCQPPRVTQVRGDVMTPEVKAKSPLSCWNGRLRTSGFVGVHQYQLHQRHHVPHDYQNSVFAVVNVMWQKVSRYRTEVGDGCPIGVERINRHAICSAQPKRRSAPIHSRSLAAVETSAGGCCEAVPKLLQQQTDDDDYANRHEALGFHVLRSPIISPVQGTSGSGRQRDSMRKRARR